MALLEKTLREALGTFDGDSATGVAVAVGAEATILSLSAPGATQVTGQVVATDGYNAYLEWRAADDTVLRRETLAEGVGAGTWTDIDVPARAHRVDLVVAENSALSTGEITVDASLQLG